MAIMAQCPVCRQKRSMKKKVCPCGENLDKAKRSGRVKYWLSYKLDGKTKWKALSNSITEAREMEAEFVNGGGAAAMIGKDVTFDGLTKWFLDLEHMKVKAYHPILCINLKNFNSVFGETLVSDIRKSDLLNYQQLRKGKGLSDSYVDQEITAARTMVNAAYDDDRIGPEAPGVFRKIKSLMKNKNANARGLVFTREQFEKIMDHLSPHLKPIFATGYFTGMRRNEILSLTRDKLDLKNRFVELEATDTKDGEARRIPICDELFEVLINVPPAIHDEHVFLYKGKPVRDIREGLMTAFKKAGVPYGRKAKGGLTFHDLRHTFNTNMRRAGVPESVIMAITGHSTRDMFDRYNTVDDSDMKGAMDRFGSYLEKAV